MDCRVKPGNDIRKTMPLTLYGIKNCDTMKKARAFLDKRGVAYDFHDYKTKGIEAKLLSLDIELCRAGIAIDIVKDGQDFAGYSRVPEFVERIAFPIIRRTPGIGIPCIS